MASECVKVMVRCRPMNSKEINRGKLADAHSKSIILSVTPLQDVKAFAILTNRPIRSLFARGRKEVRRRKFLPTILYTESTQPNGKFMMRLVSLWLSRSLAATMAQSLHMDRRAVERRTR